MALEFRFFKSYFEKDTGNKLTETIIEKVHCVTKNVHFLSEIILLVSVKHKSHFPNPSFLTPNSVLFPLNPLAQRFAFEFGSQCNLQTTHEPLPFINQLICKPGAFS